MKSSNKLFTFTFFTAVLSVALLSVPVAACAHGDAGRKKADASVKKEQKAWGIAGDAKDARRTIELKMSDTMRFTPDRIEVKQGETVKIVMTNTGAVLHEMVIGTKKELEEHAALMVKFPGMEHDEPYMAHVPPGKTGQIVWTFNRAGEFDFACLIAGHYQAGMVGKIVVRARSDAVSLQGMKLSLVAADADMAEGEVRKVDKENKKITLKHGEIKNLDMPGMTMVFQVKDAAMLDKVKPGDKVKFKAEKSGTTIMLTEIQATQ